MSDPYTLTSADGAPLTSTAAAGVPAGSGPDDRAAGRPRTDVRRAGLWLLLVLSGAANSITSVLGVPVAISAVLGLVAVACVVALVVTRTRTRTGSATATGSATTGTVRS